MLQLQDNPSDTQPGLKLAGDLTIYTVTMAKADILARLGRHPAFELNLSDVEELDTAGVQLLLWLKKTAAGNGAVLTLTHHSPAVVQVLDLLKVTAALGDPILIGP
jgi:anti-anti-sigma factor